MRSVQGRGIAPIDSKTIVSWATSYDRVAVDLGTGNGQFVRQLARSCADWAVLGIDACPDNMREISRTSSPNALFVASDALALASDLKVNATQVSINFPWGSLLRGLLEGHAGLLGGHTTIGAAGHRVVVQLNTGALNEAGGSFEEGGRRVQFILSEAGYDVMGVCELDASAMRSCPSEWAKRLAFGRDPRAVQIVRVFGRE